MYAMAKELMKKVFTANSHNKNQKIGIQVTFILEIKLQKYIFLSKSDHFFNNLFAHFESLLGKECA